uniref:Pyrokinin-like protein 1 n=1 Tax=Carausius morosus TaxID=7022 RepID=A0A8K1S5M0_CARMO|nr:pyrokinin-like protein 1 [Carausius morosus]
MAPVRHLAAAALVFLVLASACSTQGTEDGKKEPSGVWLLQPMRVDTSSGLSKDSRRQSGPGFFRPRPGRFVPQEGYVY